MTPTQHARKVRARNTRRLHTSRARYHGRLLMARRQELLAMEKLSAEQLKDRDFPDLDKHGYGRKAVCKRCHVAMVDCEPMSPGGEFHHWSDPAKPKTFYCVNANQQFSTDSLEITPWMPKSRRRALKRMNIRA